MPHDETTENVPMPKDRLEKVPADRLQNREAPEAGGDPRPDAKAEETS